MVEVGRQGRFAVHRDRAHRRADGARRARRRGEGDSQRGAQDDANRTADHGLTSIIGGPLIPKPRFILDVLESAGAR